VSNLDRLAGITTIVRMIAGNLIYRRFVSNVAVVILLIVVTGMLAGVLLISLCYAGYLTLVRHGLDTGAAMLISESIIALVTLVCCIATARYIRKLRDLLIPLPAAPCARRIMRAFVDGFSESGHKQEEHF